MNNINVGDIVNVTIKQILEDEENNVRLICNITKSVQGLIQTYHLSDTNIIPKFKVNGKLKARVLYVNKHKKSILLTLKPTLMQVEIIEQFKIGDQLNGTVYKENENGYIVQYFNNVYGYLPKSELEQSDTSIQLGQTIKVYIKYINEHNKFILTLNKNIIQS